MRLLGRSEFLQAVWGTRMECLGEDARFKVPWVWPGSTERVLVMEHMEGVSIGDAVIGTLPQEKRHEVCKLLYLFQ
jgi:aarF domain-containing kinase